MALITFLKHVQVFFDGHFITGAELKQRIVEKNSLTYGPSELSLCDPSSSLEFGDDYQIPKSSKVVVKRVAAQVSRALTGATRASAAPTTAPSEAPSTSVSISANPIDDFGADPFAAAASGLQQEQARARQAVMEASTSAPSSSAAGAGWGAGSRGGRAGGRMGLAAGRGRGGPVPRDHECKRCGEVGKHFFWLCPTKDDPAYDQAKPLQRLTGVPATSLRRNADGSMLLPDGQVGELAPNHEAFAQRLARMAGTTAAQPSETTAALLSLPGTGVKEEVKNEDVKQENGVVKREGVGLESSVAGGLFDEDEEAPHTAAPTLTLLGDKPLLEADKGASDGVGLGPSAARSRPTPPLPLAEMFGLLHRVLSAVMPSQMTMKQCDEAFGSGGPLTRAEFESFQAALKATLRPRQRAGVADRDSGGGARGGTVRREGGGRRDGSSEAGGERRREGRSRSRSRSKRDRSRSRSRSRGKGKRSSRADASDAKKKRSHRRSRSRSASPAVRRANSPTEPERRSRQDSTKLSPRLQVGSRHESCEEIGQGLKLYLFISRHIAIVLGKSFFLSSFF